MTVDSAREVLDKNALCQEGSLRQSICEDHSGYLDRIETAVRFYLDGEPINEDGFALKRP